MDHAAHTALARRIVADPDDEAGWTAYAADLAATATTTWRSSCGRSGRRCVTRWQPGRRSMRS